MQFDPGQLERSAVYKLLTGAVIPRPIGWISSISPDGIHNLAPFSFFNAIGDDPPHVMFSTVRDGLRSKDTLRNVLDTGEFVVNMVTEEVVEQMNRTASMVAFEADEFELAGLTRVPSVKIRPARVKESLVHFECRLVHQFELEDHQFGGAVMLVGRIVMMHFDESVLLDNYKIDLATYKPVARLAGSNYASLGEIFSIRRE